MPEQHEDEIETEQEPQVLPLRTRTQRRAAIRAALLEDPRRSNRAIAKSCASDHKTVQKVRKRLEQLGEIEPPALPRLAPESAPEPEPSGESEQAFASSAILHGPRGSGPRSRQTDVAALVRKHIVSRRRCGCPKHYADGFPQPCEPEWQELDSRRQLAIGEMRAGLHRESHAELLFGDAVVPALGVATVVGVPRYRDTPVDRW